MAKDHSWLYCMAFVAMLGACKSCEKLNKVGSKIERIENKVSALEEKIPSKTTLNGQFENLNAKMPEFKRANVIGGPLLEEFYEVNGVRAYTVIDGKPVATYVPLEQ